MGVFIANQVVKMMLRKGIPVKGSKCLVMGVTFKENCPDIRNSKVIDVIQELKSFGLQVDIFDPHADPEEVKEEYDIELITNVAKKYEAAVLAVSHHDFKTFPLQKYLLEPSVLYDVKGLLDKSKVDGRL